METFSIQQHAKHLLRLSQAMLKYAESGDWESFSAIEVKRQAVVESMFSHPDISIYLSQVAPVLEQVIEMDTESMALGKVEMERLRGKLNTLQHGKHASRAYQQVSGSGY